MAFIYSISGGLGAFLNVLIGSNFHKYWVYFFIVFEWVVLIAMLVFFKSELKKLEKLYIKFVKKFSKIFAKNME